MKVITEMLLREAFKSGLPDVYYVSADTLLSPAAKEYLSQKKIKVSFKNEEKDVNLKVEEKVVRGGYEDYQTGGLYEKKPEDMTQIIGNKLVYKNHPRIIFRGKMDSLQSLIVLAQAEIYSKNASSKMLSDLDEVLQEVRHIVRAEVLEEELEPIRIMNLMDSEMRDRSHHPEKFFNVKQMTLPDYKMGIIYARLNQIRSEIREAEILAVSAMDMKRDSWGKGIILSLNRLSSIMHIMMCMDRANLYKGR